MSSAQSCLAFELFMILDMQSEILLANPPPTVVVERAFYDVESLKTGDDSILVAELTSLASLTGLIGKLILLDYTTGSC
jgi:hypothetical protein